MKAKLFENGDRRVGPCLTRFGMGIGIGNMNGIGVTYPKPAYFTRFGTGNTNGNIVVPHTKPEKRD